MKRPTFPPVQPDYYPMGGGLDLVTPAITKSPGACIDAQNYEPAPVQGYRRIDGFERFDGRTQPHTASYWTIEANITGTLAVGNTLTGATSLATGKILVIDGTTIVLGRVSGTYQSGENLQVAAVTQAVATSASVERGASDMSDDADWRLEAADDRRADITTVPGSGIIRGGFYYGDTCYVFRDNVGATAGNLYKSTTGGWTQVTFGRELQFDGAVAEVFAGNTITGATSGATATVVRAMLRSGTWSTGGVGTLILSSVVGAFLNAEIIQVAAANKVVANGADTAITRLPGGKVEAVPGNFSGSSSTKRIYGCDGVNLAFEFDGTNYVPIRTGMATDTPDHIAVHKNRLFLAFGASLQYSGVNQPYSWTVLTGANEIAVGDDITGIKSVAGNEGGGALLVAQSQTYAVFYGSSSSDFNLVPSGRDLGYSEWTLQAVGNDVFGLTARGVQSMQTTRNYGDFLFNALSVLVQPLLEAKRAAGTLPTASASLKSKNQYRVFFDDDTCLVFGLTGSKVGGILPLNYGMTVQNAWSGFASDGAEWAFFGSDDGYVYRDLVGTSFDGEVIEAWIRPAFNNLRSPNVRKTYKRAIFEVASEGYAEVNATYDLGYGSPDVEPAAVQQDQTLIGQGGYWDQFTLDQFTWDAAVVSDAQISIDGAENNINFLFYSSRAQDDPHTVQGVQLMYIPRRINRGGS